LAFWPIGGIANTLFLQDMGGLIDLNTAAPDILERVVAAFELGPEAMTDYIAWRRAGRHRAGCGTGFWGKTSCRGYRHRQG